jgi:general secretion pathway protein D
MKNSRLSMLTLSGGMVLWLAACSENAPGSALAWTPAAIPLSATANASQQSVPPASPPAVETYIQSINGSDEGTPHVQGGIFTGSGFAPPRVTQALSDGKLAKDVTVNFVDADIHEVAKAVLGDMLGLNYIIAPGVTGNITLKINQPVSRNELFAALDTVFRMNGAELVSSGGIVKVIPSASEAGHHGNLVPGIGTQNTPGYGMQIVPLRFIDAAGMEKILAQVVPSGSVIPVASTRDVLIIAGTEEERTAIMQVIGTFDVDWLSGMSFGLFPLQEADASVLTRELWDVLGTQTGPLGKVVRLVPFDRLNAVLVVSSQPRYLQEIKKWIDRLDVSQAPSDRKIWVYQVQNGRAGDLSKTLDNILTQELGKPSGSPGNAQASQPIQAAAQALPFSFESGQAKGTAPIPPPPTPSALNTPQPGDQPAQSGGPHVIADETTNSLIVWANKGEFSLIRDALKKLDITPMEVRIEAAVVEVTLTDDLSYGVQYLFQNRHMGTILTNASTKAVSGSYPGFDAFVTGSNINVILDLLQSVTTLHVISSPQLMVLNNQSATLQVGNQVPVATQSAVSTLTAGAPVVNSIQMVDTGVILKVTPRVNASGMVLMDIAQEVSDVIPTTSSTIDSPTIEERKIASSVAVRSGETIALGGLIQDNVTDGRSGIPVLDEIPYVGNLFGTTTKNHIRTELLALLTPRVVRNDNDVREVTEEMRRQMTGIPPLDAQIHH